MFKLCSKLCNIKFLENIKNPQLQSYSSLILEKKIPFTRISQSFLDIRWKSNKQNSKSDSDSYKEEIDRTEEFQDKNTKIVNISVTSLRVDGILKSSFGIARNKIETMFYESKIRVNGKKILKKSASVYEGDEIDLIRGPDVKNPDFINVARIEVLLIKPKEESIAVKVRRCKSLSVEKYD